MELVTKEYLEDNDEINKVMINVYTLEDYNYFNDLMKKKNYYHYKYNYQIHQINHFFHQ